MILLFVLLVFWIILEAFTFGAILYYNLIRTVMCAAFAITTFIMWTEFFERNYIILLIVALEIALLAQYGITITSAFLGYYLERTVRLEYKLIKMQEMAWKNRKGFSSSYCRICKKASQRQRTLHRRGPGDCNCTFLRYR